MAHFAKINSENVVVDVVVVSNDLEHRAKEFLSEDLQLGGTWVQTSFNRNFRKNFAGIGYQYDPVRDAFIPPKPFPSWTLDEELCVWKPPTPPPSLMHVWDEEAGAWKLGNLLKP